MLGAAVAAALLVPLVAVAASRGDGERTPAAAPSFQRDVAPILREKCTGCHQVGGIAPLARDRPAGAEVGGCDRRGRAGEGHAAVAAGPGLPDYVGEESRQLTAQQRSTFLSWAKAGGKASGPGAGKAPAAKTDVRPGERVLTLGMSAAYRPTAKNGATDDYRCFLLDPKLTEDAYATSARIVPRARSIVHHVILFRISANALSEAKGLTPPRPASAGRALAASASAARASSLDNGSWISAWAPGWERAASRTEPASRWRRATSS